jgi:hypothetical protein
MEVLVALQFPHQAPTAMQVEPLPMHFHPSEALSKFLVVESAQQVQPPLLQIAQLEAQAQVQHGALRVVQEADVPQQQELVSMVFKRRADSLLVEAVAVEEPVRAMYQEQQALVLQDLLVMQQL